MKILNKIFSFLTAATITTACLEEYPSYHSENTNQDSVNINDSDLSVSPHYKRICGNDNSIYLINLNHSEDLPIFVENCTDGEDCYQGICKNSNIDSIVKGDSKISINTKDLPFVYNPFTHLFIKQYCREVDGLDNFCNYNKFTFEDCVSNENILEWSELANRGCASLLIALERENNNCTYHLEYFVDIRWGPDGEMLGGVIDFCIDHSSMCFVTPQSCYGYVNNRSCNPETLNELLYQFEESCK